jgi:hypothetical protein
MFDLDKQSILLYIIIAFVIIIGLKIYSESDAYNLKCIISDVDGKRYCVRERLKMELAANLLASVTQKLKDLVAKEETSAAELKASTENLMQSLMKVHWIDYQKKN